MKYIYSLSLALLLAACSSAEKAPESSLPLEGSEPALSSSETLFAPEPAPDSALATPVSSEPPASTALSEPTPPTPPGPPPPPEYVPEPDSPRKVDMNPPTSMPPVVASPGLPKGDRNIRQDFEEYKDRAKTRAQADDDFDQRTLFPHEDGAFQFGLDYAYKPFDDFDFDPGTARKLGDSMGGVLSFNYFPLRSLNFGRLGIGAQAAAYWTKFEYVTSPGIIDASKKHSIDTLGGRLIYEFQYFLGQVFVPYAFYGYDKVSVRSFALASAGANYPKRSFNSASYGAGAHFNLNRIEPTAASKALASSGIRKFYLTYTLLRRDESTGAAHFLGLRFEY